MLTEGGETPTSKKSRRHFLEVRAALLRSTSLSGDLDLELELVLEFVFLPKIEKSVKSWKNRMFHFSMFFLTILRNEHWKR